MKSILPCILLFALPALAQAASPGDALFAQGVSAMTAKHYAEAVTSLSECLKLDPRHLHCRWERGWAAYMLGDWPISADDWAAVAKADRKFPGLTEAQTIIGLHTQLYEGMQRAQKGAPAGYPAATTEVALRIRAVGDVNMGTDFPDRQLAPEKTSPFARVRPLLRDADFTFANLEGPLCDGGETTKCKPGHKCYAFRTPTRYARFLTDAGIDVVSTANNHSGDFGELCALQTESALAARGIQSSGRPGSVARWEVNGYQVSLIAFHASERTNNSLDIPAAAAMVSAESEKADYVIVSFHGGGEGMGSLHTPVDKVDLYLEENRGNVTRFSRAMIDAGAALVIGHGPHVPRAMEIYKDHLIAYSLGNFATYGPFNLSGFNGIGLVLEVSLGEEGRFAGGRIFPTRQVGEGIPVVDPRAQAVDLIRYLSQEDFPASGVRIGRDGTLGLPSRP